MGMQRNGFFTIFSIVLFLGVACKFGESAVANIGGNTGSGGRGQGGNGAAGQPAGGFIIDPYALDAGSHLVAKGADARPMRCDSLGNCSSCLAIASLGKVAHYGKQSSGGDNTDAFQTYMNTRTQGSARMAMYASTTGSTKNFTLSEDFLKSYDVVILQALEDSEYIGYWTFSQAEITALSDWVNKGGGLISLTGYGAVADEVNPLNQLLSFAGISYNKDDIFIESDCPDNLCYCTDTSMPFGGWNMSDGLLVTNLNNVNHQVGVFRGRSINCADCDVMGTWKNFKVAVHKQVGAGRVFAFADEWVTYTSQWNGDPVFQVQTQCAPRTADKIYDIPQFWYNVFRWVSGDVDCLKSDDPQIIIY